MDNLIKLSDFTGLMDAKRFQKLHWEGSFAEYLALLSGDTRLARTAFRRIYDMIMSHGYEEICDGKEKLIRYNFFSSPEFSKNDAVYGLERPLMNLELTNSKRHGFQKR